MKDFSKLAYSTLKNNLAGLPSFCRLVIYELLDYCDYPSGVISIGTLDEVARNDFRVELAPGRKKEEINGDTLRNALRTIKKTRPDFFKFSLSKQRIIIEMPFLRSLYQQFCIENKQVAAEDAGDVVVDLAAVGSLTSNNKKTNFAGHLVGDVVTDVSAASFNYSKNPELASQLLAKPEEAAAVDAVDVTKVTTLASTGEATGFIEHVSGDVAADLAAASFSLLYNNNYNNNNNFNVVVQKLFIPDDFMPNQATISEALSHGYSNVTDLDEIKNFINHNKAIGSQWADFNPVYLRWLERGFERRQQQLQHNSVNVGRKENEQRPAHTSSSGKTAMAELIARNKQIIAEYEQQKSNSLAPSSHCKLVAKIS